MIYSPSTDKESQVIRAGKALNPSNLYGLASHLHLTMLLLISL